MEQESLNEATRLVVDVIQNSNINMIDKYELLLNISLFLDHYEEAIKHRFNKGENNERPVQMELHNKNQNKRRNI